jgi:hypothetical protein
MATRRKTTPSPVTRKANVDTPPAVPDTGLGDVGAYMTDAWQRTFLFWDTLLNRGNNYIEHLDQGTPPLLKFEHEVVLDGKTLSPPCNYALLRLIPPASMPVNPQARPVVVVDPRAGHGPGIGGFKWTRKWAWPCTPATRCTSSPSGPSRKKARHCSR